MAAIAIRRPTLVQQMGNMRRQKPPVGDGSATFKAGDLVYLVAGVLALVDTAGVLVWGQTPDDSKVAGLKPPEAFFGENHYCFDLHEAVIELNGVDGTGVVGVGGATSTSFPIGLKCGVKANVAGYVGVQFINYSDTTTLLFTVVGIAGGQTTADLNPRVLAKIIPACIQG